MAPGTKRTTATASKKLKTAPYIFYKDRLGTYKNYKHDEVPHATCTSKALARAGFISTGEDAGKYPFCLKELCSDATDDPWEEHEKRGSDCSFVLLEKLDETTLTVADTIKLAQSAVIKAKYEEQVKIINGLENRVFHSAKKMKSTRTSAHNIEPRYFGAASTEVRWLLVQDKTKFTVQWKQSGYHSCNWVEIFKLCQ